VGHVEIIPPQEQDPTLRLKLEAHNVGSNKCGTRLPLSAVTVKTDHSSSPVCDESRSNYFPPETIFTNIR